MVLDRMVLDGIHFDRMNLDLVPGARRGPFTWSQYGLDHIPDN
jgi:hypothetical protein